MQVDFFSSSCVFGHMECLCALNTTPSIQLSSEWQSKAKDKLATCFPFFSSLSVHVSIVAGWIHTHKKFGPWRKTLCCMCKAVLCFYSPVGTLDTAFLFICGVSAFISVCISSRTQQKMKKTFKRGGVEVAFSVFAPISSKHGPSSKWLIQRERKSLYGIEKKERLHSRSLQAPH